eukprot:12103315-Prorocentrum_lima.AAC.1
MLVVQHRRFKIDTCLPYSLQWHWHPATLVGEAKVPTDVLAAQHESVRKSLTASGIIEADGR